MKTKHFSVRVLTVAIAAAIAQGAWAADYTGESYDKSGDYEYDNFTVTHAGQTEAAVQQGNGVLTVNQAFKVETERTTASNFNLLGAFVWANNAKLISKGGMDISVVNSSEMDDQGVFGLSLYGSAVLEGENNHIKAVNKLGNNFLKGILMLGESASLEAGKLVIDVVNEVEMTSDFAYENNAYGIWHENGKLKAQDLTINVTSKGYDNVGLFGAKGTAELGSLQVKVVSDVAESEDPDVPRAYGLWMDPGMLEDVGSYKLEAKSIKIEVESKQGGEVYGLYADFPGEETGSIDVTTGAAEIIITDAGLARGVYLTGWDGRQDALKADLGVLAMQVKGTGEVKGLEVFDGQVTTKGIKAEIISDAGHAQGAYVNSGVLTVGGDVDLTVAGVLADGMVLNYGTQATFSGKVKVNAAASGGNAQGIVLDYGVKAVFEDLVELDISAAEVGKAVNQVYGVNAEFENSTAEFKKGLKVTTSGAAEYPYAVNAEGQGSKIVVKCGAHIQTDDGYFALNAAKGGTITIESDPEFVSNISGKVLSKDENSVIDVSLDAGDSLTANSTVKDKGAFNLALNDGAVWNVAEGASTATKVKSDAGHLAFAEPGSSLQVEKLDLAGTTVVSMNDVPAEGGHYITAGSTTGDGIVRAEGTGDMNDTRTGSTEELVESTANAVFGEAGLDKVGEVHLDEGRLFGEVEAVLNENGGFDVAERTNTKLEAANTLAVLSALQWRHEMNDLTKRMGELRTSPEGIGGWARVYGSEQSYGGIDAKHASVQVGADVDVGAGWKVGAAFSYTDGSADIMAGTADSKAYGFAAYGTWMDPNGQFVDLIAKYSKLDTDFEVKGVGGSFDNNAWSVSAEYGWHFKLADVAFVEPQAEVTYGQVIGDDYMNGDGVRLAQEDFESLIGRVGVRAGFHFPNNKGLVYARASVLHDFKGEAETVATLDGRSVSFSDDLGGTWGEFGVGANFSLTDRTYTYVDLERTTGGDVSEKWRWNVGVRHVF